MHKYTRQIAIIKLHPVLLRGQACALSEHLRKVALRAESQRISYSGIRMICLRQQCLRHINAVVRKIVSKTHSRLFFKQNRQITGVQAGSVGKILQRDLLIKVCIDIVQANVYRLRIMLGFNVLFHEVDAECPQLPVQAVDLIDRLRRIGLLDIKVARSINRFLRDPGLDGGATPVTVDDADGDFQDLVQLEIL